MTAARPILLTGTHRSGTTWVGHTIAAGDHIGYLDEPFSLHARPGVLPFRWRWWFPYVAAGSAQPELRDAFAGMLNFRYSAGAELRALRSARDAGRMARDWARFGTYRYEHARPLVKDPIAVLSAPWLAGEFDMQVVILVRHPAAFAGSLKRMGWTHPFADFLRQPELMAGPLAGYREAVSRFSTHPPDVVDQAALLWCMLHSVIDTYRTDHPDWIVVRHEDLSRRPDDEFRALCGALSVGYSTAVAERVAAFTAAANPAEARAGRAHTLARNSAASLTTWKARLTPDEIERVRLATTGVWERFYGEDEW